MTNLQSVIDELESRRNAIDAAITALRGANPLGTSTRKAADTGVSEGRRRQIEAMKRYWAQRRAEKTSPKSPSGGGMTPEGRKRLSEAMRKRWAAKRSGGGA